MKTTDTIQMKIWNTNPTRNTNSINKAVAKNAAALSYDSLVTYLPKKNHFDILQNSKTRSIKL